MELKYGEGGGGAGVSYRVGILMLLEEGIKKKSQNAENKGVFLYLILMSFFCLAVFQTKRDEYLLGML